MARKATAENSGTEQPKKERRYSVDFEHYENAMLTESNLSWQVLMQRRHSFTRERREKVARMLKRFVDEMKPDLDEHKAAVLKAQAEIASGGQSAAAIAGMNGPIDRVTERGN